MGSIPAGDIYPGKSEEMSVKSEQTQNDAHLAVIRVYDEAGNVIETHERSAISASSK